MSFRFGPGSGPGPRPGAATMDFGVAPAAASPTPPAPAITIPFSAAWSGSQFGGGGGGGGLAPFPRPRPEPPAAASPTPAPAGTIPFSAVRPGSQFGGGRPAPFPRPRPESGAGVAMAGHMARHLQPQPWAQAQGQVQPRVDAPFLTSSMDPSISQRGKPLSPLLYKHVDSLTNREGNLGSRKVVKYSDSLLENGKVHASKQMRSRPSDFGRMIRSEPSNIESMNRSPSMVVQNHPLVDIPDSRQDMYMSNTSPSKFMYQNQFRISDTRSPPYPASSFSPSLVRSNRSGPRSSDPVFAGAASSPSSLGITTHHDSLARSSIAEQRPRQHIQPQSRFSVPSQNQLMEHNLSKRSRSPLSYQYVDAAEAHPSQNQLMEHNLSKRSRSPLSYQHVDAAEAHRDAGISTRRLVDYTDALSEDGNIETSKRMRSPSSELGSMIRSSPSHLRSRTQSTSGFASKSSVQDLPSRNDVQKCDAHLSNFGSGVQSPVNEAYSPPNQKFCPVESYSDEHNRTAASPSEPGILNIPKKAKTPTLNANGDESMMLSPELQREKEAKAKRLARFGAELSRPIENVDFVKVHKSSAGKRKQASSMENVPMESYDDTDEATMVDINSESAAIVGVCSEMCPESEREERERKGDLDRYERLDGDRKQTTERLAVKKYNRTAERDADLIRPLPVLQKTMDYLLSLLNHPYDDSFLGLYNFLWDRMRAIRMDLRMQHYFNEEAISMLEQMIRLHIIAMHELCEYDKGEGFSEGFDAHLNIEQMNKTSVELFQMYDHLRSEGIVFPTEKEFRGYYALLKLDRHPGYKVEPAELSLDLAKMSRKIRGSPEILFARKVARACRIGNFIAFFRLARKATYLQACLMHTHFAKLRRQALASLHSGLQNTQGIPVSHVVEWLAMEGEETEGLLEYHGFGMRQYEELYLVKEGPFLNSENDFPTRTSLLVHSKKSQRVIDDVYSGPISTHAEKRESVSQYSGSVFLTAAGRENRPVAPVAPDVGKRELSSPYPGPVSPTCGKRSIVAQNSGPFSPAAGKSQISSPLSRSVSAIARKEEIIPVYSVPTSPHASKQESVSRTMEMDRLRRAEPKAEALPQMVDEFMPDSKADSGLTVLSQGVELPKVAPFSMFNTEDDDSMAQINVPDPFANMHEKQDEFRIPGSFIDRNMNEEKLRGAEFNALQFGPAGSPTSTSDDDEYGDHLISSMEMSDDRVDLMASSEKNEISSEKLKLILRRWKQRATDRRLLREQKNALATAAFSSLSLGPPVHEAAAAPRHAVQELDIGHAVQERHARMQRSWSTLDVSELFGRVLSEKNPDAECLCWKLLIVVPPGTIESPSKHLASRWLLRKIMGAKNEDSELLASSPNLSIWKKRSSSRNKCCLSVYRASDQQVVGNDMINSTSGIIFVVSESTPWELQKARLSSLLAGIPSQANLPLLIASSDTYREGWDDASRTIVDRLGVSDVAEARISVSSVVFLDGHYLDGYANSFFNDDQLGEGLLWLANHLPVQPAVSLVMTRELILDYVKLSLEICNSHAVSEVGPEHCIAALNEAVDWVVQEISAAMLANPNQWPAPEIELLERSSNEKILADLPTIGWSSPSRIQPLLAAIESCKLPEFSSDISWLNEGSYMGREIPNQKLALEECLFKYLTQSARVLNEAQGTTEVTVMVQKFVGLELRDSCYCLVPRWVNIFRRIYNWRLAKLSTGQFSVAYVLDQHLYGPHSNGVALSGFKPSGESVDGISSSESHHEMNPVSTEISLDEIIEISCDLPAVVGPLLKPVPQQPPEQFHERCRAPADSDAETNAAQTDNADVPVSARKQQRGFMPPEMNDAKLAKLFEYCNKVQERIAEKLSIYF